MFGDKPVADHFLEFVEAFEANAFGEFVVDGQRKPAAACLREKGIAPLKLHAKEGLALINGTQVSTALALHAFISFEPVLEAALVIGALTVDAARGSDGPFDPRIHALRGQPGQVDVARYYRALLAGSEICTPAAADVGGFGDVL